MDYADDKAIVGGLFPILQTTPDSAMTGFSTPTGFKSVYRAMCEENPYFREFHYTYKVLPHWATVEKDRPQYTEDEWLHEMMADWGLAVETWQAVLYQDQQDGDVLPFDSPAGTFAATLRWSGMVWSMIRARQAPVADELVEEAAQLAQKLGVPADGFDPLIGEIKKRRREEAAFLSLGSL